MFGRRFGSVAVAAVAIGLLAMGCNSTTDEDTGSAEAAATPPNPATNYALVETCSRMFKRHEAVREVDMEQGVIRWGCGDVPGVTNDDLGQEYCEYQAVQNGAIKKKPTDLAAGAPVSCVFTSVFRDVNAAVDAKLKAELAKPENLGATPATSPIYKMKGAFNSRNAATVLLDDCQAAGVASTITVRTRTAACFQAVSKGGPNAAELATVCKGNLATPAVWAQAEALGAKIVEKGDPAFEEQSDLAACMAVRSAGVPWRNSDPMICARAARAASECGCTYESVPQALEGFPFVGWVDDQIPAGCRFAKVGGQDYPYVVICPVSDQEIADLPLNPLYNGNIGNFCRDRFAMDFVMKLPIRDLQTPGTCSDRAGFCSEYMGGDEPAPQPSEPKPSVTPDESRAKDPINSR